MYQDCANYTQAYIRDLENKLRIYSDKDDTHIEVVIELRKELAKLKETEANSNRYISELETRLSKSDDINSGLSRKVETLEKEITVREGLYRDLEARVALLDTTSENKVLLNELDTRDKRVAELEKLLEQAVQGRDVADEEQTKMKTKVEAGQVVQMGLLQQISMLQAPRISRAPTPGDAFYTPAEEMAQPSLVSPSPASSRSELTPPDTPDTQRGMVRTLPNRTSSLLFAQRTSKRCRSSRISRFDTVMHGPRLQSSTPNLPKPSWSSLSCTTQYLDRQSTLTGMT
jgi:hypothetical protein